MTYSNFPTEYLELPFLDFATFNVYLRPRRRYAGTWCHRNLVGDRPLVLGSWPGDPPRRLQQFLTGHLRGAARWAGRRLHFSWTDDWHTGGFPIGRLRHHASPSKAAACVAGTVSQLARARCCRQPPCLRQICSYNADLKNTCGPWRGTGLSRLRSHRWTTVDGRVPSIPALPVGASSTRTIWGCRGRNTGLERRPGRPSPTPTPTALSTALADAPGYQFEPLDAAAVGGESVPATAGWPVVSPLPGRPCTSRMRPRRGTHSRLHMAFGRKHCWPSTASTFSTRARRRRRCVLAVQQAGYWITRPGAFAGITAGRTPRLPASQSGYSEAERPPLRTPTVSTGAATAGAGSSTGRRYKACGCRRRTFSGSIWFGSFSACTRPPAHWATLPAVWNGCW